MNAPKSNIKPSTIPLSHLLLIGEPLRYYLNVELFFISVLFLGFLFVICNFALKSNVAGLQLIKYFYYSLFTIIIDYFLH